VLVGRCLAVCSTSKFYGRACCVCVELVEASGLVFCMVRYTQL